MLRRKCLQRHKKNLPSAGLIFNRPICARSQQIQLHLSDSQITAKNNLHSQGTHYSAAKNGKNILLDSFEENATLNCVGSQ